MILAPVLGLDLTQVDQLTVLLGTVVALITGMVMLLPNRTGKILENAERALDIADRETATHMRMAEEQKARAEREEARADVEKARADRLERQLTLVTSNRDRLAKRLLDLGEDLDDL